MLSRIIAVRKIRKIPAIKARWNGLRENAGCAGLRERVGFDRLLAGLRFVVVLRLRVDVLFAAGFFAGVLLAGVFFAAGLRVVVLRVVDLLRELAAVRFVVLRLLAADLVGFDFAIRPVVHDPRLC